MATPKDGIKKLQISETVLFAIHNIPGIDQATLEKFLELVNTTGTFGAISHEQIIAKMHLTLKYIPDACPHSLLILGDLLEIPMSTLLDRYPTRPPARLPASQVEPTAVGASQISVPAA
jgi:hypothetical protein